MTMGGMREGRRAGLVDHYFLMRHMAPAGVAREAMATVLETLRRVVHFVMCCRCATAEDEWVSTFKFQSQIMMNCWYAEAKVPQLGTFVYYNKVR